MKSQTTAVKSQSSTLRSSYLTWSFCCSLRSDNFNSLLFILRVFRNPTPLKSQSLPVYVPRFRESHSAKVFQTLHLYGVPFTEHFDYSHWFWTSCNKKEDSIQKLVTVLQTSSIALQGNSLIFKAVPQRIKHLQTLSDTGQLRETAVYYHAWIFLIHSQLNCQIFVVQSL